MPTILSYVSNGSRWIFGTFSGVATRQRKDVPGLIALWLFRIGTVWAILLTTITLVLLIAVPALIVGRLLVRGKSVGAIHLSDPMVWVYPYLVIGYAIWIGWGWRSRKPRSLLFCSFFWLTSACFNVLQPIHIWMDSHNFWDLLYPPSLWGTVATVASLVALIFEFVLQRYESPAA